MRLFVGQTVFEKINKAVHSVEMEDELKYG